ncbi:hypothetical protein RF11_06013 [Thelohanellus kitauei]|uniref:Uncharacterized protein n=1 Tax=Thelohanellus kitauei TaxID=669202 RepID=A0A0C2NA00_THEKT|nr:hypothetical protein RF11_06013 [Thelohanellus kitauei]
MSKDFHQVLEGADPGSNSNSSWQCSLKDENIRDAILFRSTYPDIHAALLQKKAPTLEQAVSIAEAHVITSRTINVIENEEPIGVCQKCKRLGLIDEVGRSKYPHSFQKRNPKYSAMFNDRKVFKLWHEDNVQLKNIQLEHNIEKVIDPVLVVSYDRCENVFRVDVIVRYRFDMNPIFKCNFISLKSHRITKVHVISDFKRLFDTSNVCTCRNFMSNLLLTAKAIHRFEKSGAFLMRFISELKRR